MNAISRTRGQNRIIIVHLLRRPFSDIGDVAEMGGGRFLSLHDSSEFSRLQLSAFGRHITRNAYIRYPTHGGLSFQSASKW